MYISIRPSRRKNVGLENPIRDETETAQVGKTRSPCEVCEHRDVDPGVRNCMGQRKIPLDVQLSRKRGVELAMIADELAAGLTRRQVALASQDLTILLTAPRIPGSIIGRNHQESNPTASTT